MLVHAETIRNLKSRWNALATISRLPDEVLAGAFLQLNLFFRNDQLQWRSIDRYRWITVCQVCVHWRSVALSTPRLWNDITVTRSLGWMREVLARSQRAPLRVRIALTSLVDGMGESARLVLRELGRIEDLVIGVSADALEILRALDAPAPLLRSLNIEGVRQRMSRQPGGERQIPPPQVLARATTAQLEQLDLLHCKFPWNLPVPFTSLTHLKVVGTGADRPPIAHVIMTLASFKILESLDLEGMIPTLTEGATALPTPAMVVRFPRLKRLRLVGETMNCANLLNRLVFPSSVSIALECTSKRGLADLAACLRSRTPAIDQPRMLMLEEDFSGSTFYVRASPRDGPIRAADPSSLVVTFRHGPDTPASSSLSRYAIPFCLHLALENVDCVCTAGLVPPSYDEEQTKEWATLFIRMCNLTELSLSGLATYRLPDALVAKRWDGQEGLCLPTLRRVTVEDVTFGLPETFSRGLPGQFTEQLVQTLNERAREAPRLESLRIKRSKRVDMPDVRMLEKVVGKVEWDGTVDADPEREEYDLNYY